MQRAAQTSPALAERTAERAEFRAKAEKCLRLAGAIADEQAQAALRQLALEYEAHADGRDQC